MKFFSLASCVLVVVLTSCGGIRYDLHPKMGSSSVGELAPVEVAVGQELMVLKHSQGIAIAGGYKAGLRVADPSLAEVRYGDGSEDDSFAPQVYVTGLKPGVTRACYVNRLGDDADYSDPRRSFSLIVK